MRYKFLFAFPLFAVFILAACSKHGNPKPANEPKNDTNIYVAGSTIASNGYVEATYWRNGTPFILHANTPGKLTPSQAVAVATSGHDLFFAGYTSENGFIATVWKNGVESLLPSNGPYSSATGIFVNGNDVYVCGYSYNLTNEPTYNALVWKNGVAVDLEYSLGSMANGIFVSGNDVYVTGSISTPVGTSAVYWKNGKVVMLNSNNILAAGGNSILVNGTDVYVTGSAFYSPGTPYFATYWKNGNAIMLGDSTEYSVAKFMVIHNGDVHVLGTLTIGNQDSPIYWKNGAVAQSNTGYSSFSAMAFDENKELYFLGQSGSFGYYARNGKNIKLAGNGNTGSFAYAMVLSPY